MARIVVEAELGVYRFGKFTGVDKIFRDMNQIHNAAGKRPSFPGSKALASKKKAGKPVSYVVMYDYATEDEATHAAERLFHFAKTFSNTIRVKDASGEPNAAGYKVEIFR